MTTTQTPAPPAIEYLPLASLKPSSFNPRRTFDETGIAELADSIHRDGLLENLIVRPHWNGGKGKLRPDGYEIIAAARRFRALRLLASKGRFDRNKKLVPCQVRKADEAAARALALLENLQREDLPPLEEGEAFAALQTLDPKAWSCQAIAARIHKTPRFVQQRLALATKLVPTARQALAKGKLTIEQARELSSAAPAQQERLAAEVAKGPGWRKGTGWTANDPATLRDEIRRTWIPLGRAIFDVADYKGTVDERDGARCATDAAAFMKLQRKACKAKVAKLAETWAWAKMGALFHDWNYEKAKGGTKAGAFVECRNDGTVKIHTGFAKRHEGGGGPANYAEQQKRYEEQHRRDEAVRQELLAWAPLARAAIAAKPTLAARLAIVVLGSDSKIGRAHV